ncbi:hypothetical protein [Dyella silvae]|uniref:hypothetical protein n=1 Tax=Dyella silvae TaxID=2994424 RepID=UPI0022647B5E|nr:hypothetical protein [Dyella silvae]
MNVKGGAWCVLAALLIFSSSAGLSGCSNTLFVESAEVTNGALEGFSIGMSKDEALVVARQKGVEAIRPVLPARPSINFSDASRLVSPGEGRSLELADDHGGKVVFTFGDCRVSDVRAEGDLASSWADSVGVSSAQLISGLKDAVSSNHNLAVREVITSDNRNWIEIDRASRAGHTSINAYDVWSFDIHGPKPAGAEFVIYFAEGALVRISYKRPRIRLD